MSQWGYVHKSAGDATGRPYRGTSWHVILTPTRMFDTYRTLCGRTITSKDTMQELPAAKSCETCLRIAARQDDDPNDEVPADG